VAVTPESNDKRFYSPLVKNIAKQEGLSLLDLAQISGSGSEGRVTKNDILLFVASRKTMASVTAVPSAIRHEDNAISGEPITASVESATASDGPKTASVQPSIPSGVGNVASEVVEMSRMGKLIAQHMVSSVQTSAHVQSFIEVDVTKIVAWRNKVKDVFTQREGEKFTFTPIFMEAVAVALKKYPMMNISLEGDRIIKHKHIHIGMAAALPDGNLIVPVIKHADQLNITGMAKVVNDLATRARDNKLKPDEIKGGTYTVTNVGSFGSVFGTPIINQPQVGILALGAIRKVPSVIETNEGDFIGIRSKMFLSHSYDHRIVNGALGGMFIKTIAEYLEAWDPNRAV
jgi:2-oxoglutarate dehydrogenase E2 component (dihydrolipoamide succinyltransferase)